MTELAPCPACGHDSRHRRATGCIAVIVPRGRHRRPRYCGCEVRPAPAPEILAFDAEGTVDVRIVERPTRDELEERTRTAEPPNPWRGLDADPLIARAQDGDR